MAADETDKAIARVINSYITQARIATKKEGTELIKQAFLDIKSDRQEKCLSDLTYSSAEHYLFARHMAAYVEFTFIVPALAYDAYKYVAGNDNTKSLGLGNQCPVSDVDSKQTKWKTAGVMHGRWDFWHRSGPVPRVNADWLN